MVAERKSLLTAVVCAATIAALAGCSQDGDIEAESGTEEKRKDPVAATSKAPADVFAALSADRIGDKAVAATKAARSLRMTGQIRNGGEHMSIDLAVDNRGSCTGKLGIEGGNAELRQVDKVMYLKGDEKFWRASLDESGTAGPRDGGVADVVKGRWIKMPAGSAEDMGDVCDLKAMLAEMDKEKSDRRGMVKGPDAKVGGRPTTTLVKKAGHETTTLYVAEEGEPYLLKVVKAGGDEPGTMLFSDYNEPVKAVAPAADEVVDLGNPGAGLGTAPGTGADTDS
jgi:hypothetical protein